MTQLKNKKKSRAGYKGYLSYAFPEVKKCLKDYTEDIMNEIERWKEALREQLEKVTTLSDQILTLIEADDESTEIWYDRYGGGTRHQQTAVLGEVAIVRHRETASHKFAEWTAAVIAQPLRGTARASSPMVVPSDCSLSGKIVETRGLGAASLNGRSSGTPLRVQLTNNATLADVDKFSYLRGLLIKLARSAIAGFSLTSVNYKAATGLLKRSYGKRTAIQRTHIKDLMNIEPIYSERDAHWLRALCDFAEIKHRALEPLGVTKKHTPPSWCHHCWRNF